MTCYLLCSPTFRHVARPCGPGDSPIVSVAATGGLERLQASGIRTSVRAGAVRVSFHLHNTDADVDAVARALGR